MKITLRISLLLMTALLVLFGLSSCGNPAKDDDESPVDSTYAGNPTEEGVAIENGDGIVTLNLEHFVVVYDSESEQSFIPSVAKAFASRAAREYDLSGVAEDESVNEFEILFGECDRDAYRTTDRDFMFRDFYIQYENNKLSVSAFSIYGYEQAINFLLLGSDNGKITIPVEGLYVEYDYGTGRLAEILKNYENPNLEGTWMVNVCHRGDVTTKNYPENSIPAYQSCLDNNVDIIETDLKITRDGVWVICHDATIDRTTTGIGKIVSMSYEQTQNYYLKTQNGGDDSEVTAYKIPTLVEIIDLCKDKVIFNLDQLSYFSFQKVYDIFEEKGAVKMAMFKTDSWEADDVIEWFCELLEDDRELPLYAPMLYSDTKEGAIAYTGLTSMIETGREHSPETIEFILGQNIRAMCLTALHPELENVETWTSLKEVGYTAIMNDSPIQLNKFIHGD